MTARTKLILLIGTVGLVIWLGVKLGGAVEDLGNQIQSNRTAAMGR